MADLATATDLVTKATGKDVRVRFCPSPTGTPHVGMARTALFNWAYARHTGGKFIFRIEDTDGSRDSEDSYAQIVEAMRWLGLDWDEGIDVGGPNAPYRQSERHDIYLDVIERLKADGYLYESYVSPEEMDARNLANGRDKQQGYDNFERDLTDAEREAFKAAGRQPALRLRVPDADLSFDDLVRGPITFPAGSFTDFVVVRPNGQPLYTLVNPVDDALMGVTHVLRGEDLLPSTPRQIALYHALIAVGITTFVPRFGHMPVVLGEGNKKLSKRDPESNLFLHRDAGFIPEGMINYLALLGWSIAADRDVFSPGELVEAFDIEAVNPNPARFDQKKADSINATHLRQLSADDYARRIVPYLASAGLIAGSAPDAAEAAKIDALVPLIQERINLLGEVPAMVAFAFVSSDALEYEAETVAAVRADAEKRGADAVAELRIAAEALSTLGDSGKPEWTAEHIQNALQTAMVDGLGLKPRVAFGAIRTAISGRRVSPPLFESIELIGKGETLARFARFETLL